MPEDARKSSPAEETGEIEDFESGLRRLEDLVAGLESGEVGLEEAVARYQEGVRLLQGLHRSLAAADREVRRLTDVLRADIARLEEGGEPGAAPAGGGEEEA